MSLVVRPARRFPTLAAAAVVLLLPVVVWLGAGAARWWQVRQSQDAPAASPVPQPDLTPVQRAEHVRPEALTACRAKQWDTCAAELDWAKALDPAGESEARVVAARARILAATASGAGDRPAPSAP